MLVSINSSQNIESCSDSVCRVRYSHVDFRDILFPPYRLNPQTSFAEACHPSCGDVPLHNHQSPASAHNATQFPLASGYLYVPVDILQSTSVTTAIAMPKSSFTTRKLNSSTFVITEDDAYAEHPLIYVKVHPRAQVLVVSDTGCDKASKCRVHGE